MLPRGRRDRGRGLGAHRQPAQLGAASRRRTGFVMNTLPRVGLILTGGTIDSVGTDRLDLAWYIEANRRLGDGELLSRLPELKTIATVQEIPFRRLPSQALVDKDWLDL